MYKLGQFILTIALTITITNGDGRNPVLEDNNFRFALPEEDKFPSTNIVPSNLKVAEEVYSNLLADLAEQLAVEDVHLKANGYFPKGKYFRGELYNFTWFHS